MTRSEVLNNARKCVCEDRDKQYGSPEDNFARIAALWSNYKGMTFTPKDVAVMMVLVKVARLSGGNSIDNYVDIAGYAACGGEIASEREAIAKRETIAKREIVAKREIAEKNPVDLAQRTSDAVQRTADFETRSQDVLFSKVDADLGSILLEKGEDGPRRRSYFRDRNLWTAIDNSTGDCWVKDFENVDDCILWLCEERETEDDYDWEENHYLKKNAI